MLTELLQIRLCPPGAVQELEPPSRSLRTLDLRNSLPTLIAHSALVYHNYIPVITVLTIARSLYHKGLRNVWKIGEK